MDRDNAIVAASITLVAAICSFIFWGPTAGVRPRRKSVVIGLQNLGLTCYLNSLLQALSSCDIFVEWINKQKYKGQVAIAMQELVNILSNRTEFTSDESFVSPVELIHALHHAGWTITNTQQDVHELLCTLLNILEEESHKTYFGLNVGYNIVECADINNTINECNGKPELRLRRRTQSASDNTETKNTSLGDLTFPRKNHHTSHEHVPKDKQPNGFLSPNICSASSSMSNCSSMARTEDSFKKRRRNVGNKPRPSPFRGYLMNRIECTQCSYKSVLKFEKFDIISLHLPESSQQQCIYKLTQLLENFIKHEMINDICCEGCNEGRHPSSSPINAPGIKLIRFGKMPSCLCFHIVRTTYQECGVYKRQDYVDFPEYLIMDPYIYRSTKNNSFTSEQTMRDLCSQTVKYQRIDADDANNSNMLPKYTYKLNAVIVHRGSHNDGHFMTYRRGCPNVPGDSNASKRWFLVSDVDVKEMALINVLSSVAYVLLYEKCSDIG